MKKRGKIRKNTKRYNDGTCDKTLSEYTVERDGANRNTYAEIGTHAEIEIHFI